MRVLQGGCPGDIVDVRFSRRPLSAVVLAAGEGTRMRSAIPKPLHSLCGRPMVVHVLDALAELGIERVVVVVGHGANEVTKVVQAEAPSGFRLEFVEQTAQLGTGDAVGVGLTGFPETFADIDDADLLVLPGDTPLVRPATIAALVRRHRDEGAAASVLTATPEDALGYSRIIRDKDGAVARIVDDRDCSLDELDVVEVATQIYCFRHSVLAPALRRIMPDIATGELFITRAIEILHDAGYPVISVPVDDPIEAAGVNDRAQLAAAEAEMRSRVNGRWMRRGVTMVDPEATYVGVNVSLSPDVVLLPGTMLEGMTSIGAGAVIGPAARLVDCEVGAGARIEAASAERATIGDNAVVRAFSVLEPGSRLAPGEQVGPFFGRS
jgi:bifunctional UDP-N-acetylglucosamine pyrophosphorylase/glucosamine-1-phosphate N-acetyltransferase